MKLLKKTFSFQLSKKAEASDVFEFEGHASVFGNVDLANEVVVNGAFRKSIEARPSVKLLWQHRHDYPIGIIELSEDEKGLFVKAKMPLKNSKVADIAALMNEEVPVIDSMSIGYMIEKSNYDSQEKIKYLTELKLYEISLVTFPCNEAARVSGFKSATEFTSYPLANLDHPWEAQSAEARVREFTKAMDEPNLEYRDTFFWFDEQHPELFTSYKLPFVDIVDGELKAIPKAIFAIAGVLNGARGGVDIPDKDRNSVIDHVNRYYELLDMESPIKKFIGLSEMKAIKTKKDFERCLRNSGSFSRNAAKLAVARFAPSSYSLREANETLNDSELKSLKDLATNLKKFINTRGMHGNTTTRSNPVTQ